MEPVSCLPVGVWHPFQKSREGRERERNPNGHDQGSGFQTLEYLEGLNSASGAPAIQSLLRITPGAYCRVPTHSSAHAIALWETRASIHTHFIVPCGTVRSKLSFRDVSCPPVAAKSL